MKWVFVTNSYFIIPLYKHIYIQLFSVTDISGLVTDNSGYFFILKLGFQGASRPSSISTCNSGSICVHFLFVQYITITIFLSIYYIFFRGTSEFYENQSFWRHIFVTLSTLKPQKCWARSVEPFWRLLETNKQTDTQATAITVFNIHVTYSDVGCLACCKSIKISNMDGSSPIYYKLDLNKGSSSTRYYKVSDITDKYFYWRFVFLFIPLD